MFPWQFYPFGCRRWRRLQRQAFMLSFHLITVFFVKYFLRIVFDKPHPLFDCGRLRIRLGDIFIEIDLFVNLRHPADAVLFVAVFWSFKYQIYEDTSCIFVDKIRVPI